VLVDRENPQALHGTVRAVADDEEHPFADGQTLLALLHQICLTRMERPEAPSREEDEED
jgi:hypothetical protein